MTEAELYKELGILTKDNDKMKYYEAYDERYRAVHDIGLRWTSDVKTPIVLDTLKKYCKKSGKVLEKGVTSCEPEFDRLIYAVIK